MHGQSVSLSGLALGYKGARADHINSVSVCISLMTFDNIASCTCPTASKENREANALQKYMPALRPSCASTACSLQSSNNDVVSFSAG